MASPETMMQSLQGHLERQEAANRQLIFDVLSIELRMMKLETRTSLSLKVIQDLMLDRGGHSLDELKASIEMEVSDPPSRARLLSLLEILFPWRRIE